MKFITKFYFLPFLLGMIISTILYISSYDANLKLEAFAKLNYNHSLSDETSTIYWETTIRNIVKKYQKNENLIVMRKRDMIRFYSKNFDVKEIEQSYLEIKNEVEKYKKEYLKYIENRILLDVKKTTFTKKMYKIISNSDVILNLENKNFLLDLNINKILIPNYQIISITLLISFMVTVIFYNIKKLKNFKF